MRAVRVVSEVVLLLALLLGLGGALVWLSLEVPSTRGAIARWAIGMANAAMDEKLTLEGVEHLSPFRVRVRHVLLRDATGKKIVDAYGVQASFDPWALLDQKVRIPDAHVERARIYTAWLEDETPSDEPQAPEEPTRWQVRIPRAHVGLARIELASPLGPVVAHAARVEGAFFYGHDYRIQIDRAQLFADLRGERVLRARISDSALTGEAASVLHLEGSLGGASLQISGRIVPFGETPPWPTGHLRLSLTDVTDRTLRALGLGSGLLTNPTDIEMTLAGDAARLKARARVTPEGEKPILLSGSWSREALDLALEVPRRPGGALSPQLPSGALGGSLQLHAALKDAKPTLRLRWEGLTIADVVLPNGRLTAKKRGHLVLLRELDLQGFTRNVRAQGRIDLETHDLSAQVRLDDVHLSKLHVLRGEPLSGVLSGELSIRTNDSLRFQAHGTLEARGLRLRSLGAEHVAASVDARGSFEQPSGHASIHASGLSLPRVPLTSLDAEAELAHGEGQVTLSARGEKTNVRAELHYQTEPGGFRLQGEGALREGGQQLRLHYEVRRRGARDTLALRLRGAGGQLHVQAQRGPRRLTLELDADRMQLSPILALLGIAKQHGRLQGQARLVLPFVRGRARATRAALRADLAFSLPLGPLLSLLDPPWAALAGQASGKLVAHGTMEQPHVELRAEMELRLPDQEAASDRFDLALSIDPESTSTELSVFDAQGQRLDAAASLSGSPLAALSKLQRGESLPSFESHTQLTPRRLDAGSDPIAYLLKAYELDLPIRVGGGVRLSAQDDALQGDAALRVRVFGDSLGDGCAAGAFTDLDVTLGLDREVLNLGVRGNGDRGGKLTLKARSSLRVREGYALTIEPANVHATARGIRLGTLPGLCALRTGVLDLELYAERLGSAQPKAQLQLEAKRLGASDEAAPLDLRLEAHANARRLTARGAVYGQGHKAGSLRAELPLRVTDGLLSLDRDAQGSAQVTLDALPVAPFLSIGSALGRAQGTVSGAVCATGSIADPELSAKLSLHKVALSIASIAQPLRGIRGSIELHNRALSVHGLTGRDGEGKVRVDGFAKLQEDYSGKIRLEVDADRFPIRRQGQVIGELTTRAGLAAALDSQLDLSGDVRIHDGRMWFTGKTGSDVQPLDKNPDIYFVDARGQAERAAEQAADAQSKEPELSLARLHLQSQKDLWFMHEDFSVQLGLDLTLLSEDGNEKLVGEVNIRRGELSLLGKPFSIERGSVQLTGDYPPDPQLNLRASFEPPAGRKLYIEVHGRASSPIVSFSGAADNAEQAMAIVSGLNTLQSGAEQRAQADARGFATNLTAGLLSATARRKLGDWVPLISIESGSTGAPSRARAGFDASKLIPDVLRPVARGAYVEGIVGNTHQTQSGTIGLGVRLELSFPHDLVGSLGYGPGPSWSSDLSWMP